MKYRSFSCFAVIVACFGFVLTVLSNNSKDTAQDIVDLRTEATENSTWEVCYDQGKRTKKYYQADTTDKHIFFSYSKYSCVDVYDHEGAFQYSIILPNQQNGVVGVRCEDGKAYIIAKDDSVFIFEELTLLRHLSREEAIDSGYTWSWFDDKEERLAVGYTETKLLDENGNIVKTIVTPTTIRETAPLVASPLLMFVIIFAVVLSVVAIIVSSVRPIFRDLANGVKNW